MLLVSIDLVVRISVQEQYLIPASKNILFLFSKLNALIPYIVLVVVGFSGTRNGCCTLF